MAFVDVVQLFVNGASNNRFAERGVSSRRSYILKRKKNRIIDGGGKLLGTDSSNELGFTFESQKTIQRRLV